MLKDFFFPQRAPSNSACVRSASLQMMYWGAVTEKYTKLPEKQFSDGRAQHLDRTDIIDAHCWLSLQVFSAGRLIQLILNSLTTTKLISVSSPCHCCCCFSCFSSFPCFWLSCSCRSLLVGVNWQLTYSRPPRVLGCP